MSIARGIARTLRRVFCEWNAGGMAEPGHAGMGLGERPNVPQIHDWERYELGVSLSLRDSEIPGAAEFVLARRDGSHSVIPISERKVRSFNAKLANIIARRR